VCSCLRHARGSRPISPPATFRSSRPRSTRARQAPGLGPRPPPDRHAVLCPRHAATPPAVRCRPRRHRHRKGSRCCLGPDRGSIYCPLDAHRARVGGANAERGPHPRGGLGSRYGGVPRRDAEPGCEPPSPHSAELSSRRPPPRGSGPRSVRCPARRVIAHQGQRWRLRTRVPQRASAAGGRPGRRGTPCDGSPARSMRGLDAADETMVSGRMTRRRRT
jgi:hypothetical protein